MDALHTDIEAKALCLTILHRMLKYQNNGFICEREIIECGLYC